jgi:O-acetyl-ADP-ribose deacetylase (regulator of RNase III)
MATVFVSGDLFEHDGIRAFAHGCNCAGTMGKGIAVEFRRRFPAMYDDYKRRCTEGRFGLGDVFTWSEGDLTVFNLGTQKTPSTLAEIGAIETAMARMLTVADGLLIPRIGMPRIGAGLGGLPWGRVREVMQRIGDGTKIELVVFEEYVKGAPAKLLLPP